MLGIKRFSVRALLFAGLLSVLVSLGAFTPVSAATSPAEQPTIGKVNVTVWDGSLMSIVPIPVANAIVSFRDRNGAIVAKGLTDATGSYSIALPPANYKMVVYANGFKESITGITVTAGKILRLQIPLLR